MTPDQTRLLIADLKKDPRASDPEFGRQWLRRQLTMRKMLAASKIVRRISKHPGVLEEIIIASRMSPPDQFEGELPREIMIKRMLENGDIFEGMYSRLY